MKRMLSCLAVLLASFALDASAQLAPDCAAIASANPSALDGDYLISSGGRAFRVYCHDMAGNPRDYLTLVNTGGDFNYSMHGDVGGPPVIHVTTHYTRVRLDPGTLLVNIGDQTFSTSEGDDCCYGTTHVTSMPYATAASCAGQMPDGRANVDLSGTPFIVDDTFTIGGWFAAGFANSGVIYTFFDQQRSVGVQGPVVNIGGGGGCGATSPHYPAGGLNHDGGFDLQLAWVGPSISLDKDSCKNGGWQEMGVFKNQGDCVSYFATGAKNPPAL